MPLVFNKRMGDAPQGAVYVGRPGPWGNPFTIGRDGTRAEVIEKYERWLTEGPGRRRLEQARQELKGRDLVCWCHPLACHAQVLMEHVNA